MACARASAKVWTQRVGETSGVILDMTLVLKSMKGGEGLSSST